MPPSRMSKQRSKEVVPWLTAPAPGAAPTQLGAGRGGGEPWGEQSGDLTGYARNHPAVTQNEHQDLTPMQSHFFPAHQNHSGWSLSPTHRARVGTTLRRWRRSRQTLSDTAVKTLTELVLGCSWADLAPPGPGAVVSRIWRNCGADSNKRGGGG